MEFFSEIIGWIGASLVVGAYILISYKKVNGGSILYQSMNFVGAICVGINAYYQHAWPSLGIQGVWGIIALFTLLKNKISKE